MAATLSHNLREVDSGLEEPEIQLEVKRLQGTVDDLRSAVTRLISRVEPVSNLPAPMKADASGPPQVDPQMSPLGDALRNTRRDVSSITDQLRRAIDQLAI